MRNSHTKKKVGQKEANHFLEHGLCPVCKNNMIRIVPGSVPDARGTHIVMDMQCMNCLSDWKAVFQPTQISIDGNLFTLRKE